MDKPSFAIVFCLLILSFSVSAQPDPFLQKHRELIEKTPRDLDFTISFKNDQTKFRQGEIILIELKFTSSAPDYYNFTNRSYDRSGRLHMDSYILDKKENTFDPLYDYFYRRGATFMMGGLYSVPTLDATLQIVKFELNEYLSFKKPGKYRLYVASPRVSVKGEKTKGNPFGNGKDAVTSISNIIEFEILPAERKWQDQKLAEAIQLIEKSTRKENNRQGCEILRFLGTRKAAQQMLSRFSREEKICQFENYVGLYSSPERRFIVAEMEKMLASPEVAVSDNFLEMLVELNYFLNNPETKSENKDTFRGYFDRENLVKDAIKLVYLEKLSDALISKNKFAFAKSLETYFSSHINGEKQTPPELTSALINSFSKLSKWKQARILENAWDKVKNPSMLPILQTIYNDLERLEIDDFDGSRPLINMAIQRIYDLDRTIGERIIINEIRRPKQKVYTSVLELLPEKATPELENLLLDRAINKNTPADGLDSVFLLIERYGTPKIIAKLRETYESNINELKCEARMPLLRIFLASDIEFGARMLEKAIRGNAEKNCIGNILISAVAPNWSPEIEQVVLFALEDDDLFVSGSAVQLLRKYGSINVRDNIWKRLERFNKEYKDKEIVTDKTDYFSNYGLYKTEADYAAALAESPNWWFDYEQLQRLAGLCLYDYCRERVEKLTKIFGTPAGIQSTVGKNDEILFSVIQYKEMSLESLKKKLDQFPPDTTFRWIPNDKNPDDDKNFLELKEFVGKRGMKLIK